MAPELLQKVEGICAANRSHRRIGLSEFSHGRKWRDDLAESGVIEIVDRDKSAGWLISWECLNALTLRIQELEEEREYREIMDILEDRRDRTDYRKGEELADAATAYFDDRYEEWKRRYDESDAEWQRLRDGH